MAERFAFFEKGTKALEFEGIKTWINSEPLSIANLRGKVVFLDFWTYTCINCRRALPFMKRYYDKYKEHDFILIGVHTPEFSFEAEERWVRKAVEKLGIKYPVALDSNNLTWFKYGDSYWPLHFLIDSEGNIVFEHVGEGDYEEMERMIIEEIRKIKPDFKAEPEKGVQDWLIQIGLHRITPELYLGYRRMNAYEIYDLISPYRLIKFETKKDPKLHKVSLDGYWMFNDECITYIKGEAKIKLHFYAKNVYAVVNSLGIFPMMFKVLLDGSPLDNSNRGSDMNDDSMLIQDMPDMYNLISLEKYEEHILEIIPMSEGVSFYTFTFG